MTKGGLLPKGFERQSNSGSQEKYEEVKPSTKSITLRISKFNPEKDNTSTFLEFTVPYQRWTTVLDTILEVKSHQDHSIGCLLYTSPSPRDGLLSRMPSSA